MAYESLSLWQHIPSLFQAEVQPAHIIECKRPIDTETGGPARLPASLWATNNVKMFALRKIIFCTGTRAVEAGQKSIALARRVQRTKQPRKDHSHTVCTPRVPIWLSFNIQQGPPLSEKTRASC